MSEKFYARTSDKVLSTIEVDARPFEVKVTDEGQFYVATRPRPGGDPEHVYADSLKGLREKLKKLVRSEKLAVPVSLLEHEGRWGQGRLKLRHGVLVGKHAANSNILFREDAVKGGAPEQLRNYGSNAVLRRLTEEEATELERLDGAKKAAADAYEDYLEPLKVNAAHLLEAAQVAAVEAAEGKVETKA